MKGSPKLSLTFEELYGALVLLGGGATCEGAKVAALSGFRIFLARVKPVFAGFQFSDHLSTL